MALFDELVRLALEQSGNASQRAVIEKELLHYDILFCLDEAGLLDQLTFQGGTALRLCYGSVRLSEDLDFAGGANFDAREFNEISQCVRDYVGPRYGLPVEVKDPKSLLGEPGYEGIKVDKWQIAVTTSPSRRDLPKQKIKLEIGAVDAYSREPRTLAQNYDFLPVGYQDTLVLTESRSEIMADKLVSFVASEKYIRYRDVWDLVWLKRQGISWTSELVSQKLLDYRLNNYAESLAARLLSLEKIAKGGGFESEMRRFVPEDVYRRTLGKRKYLSHVVLVLEETLQELQQGLFGSEK